MADIGQEIGNIIQNYWYFFVIAALAVFVIGILLKGRKSEPRPVQRSEVERRQFIQRMKANDSYFTRMKQDNKNKYAITKLQISKKKDDDKEIMIYEMVMKPLLARILPFGEENGYVFSWDSLDWDASDPKTLILKDGASLWLRHGIFMDNSFSKPMTNYFNREYSAQTDLETLSSEYYAMGQENSVIQPDRAHATLTDHLNIERIKEERKKQQLSG